MALRTWLTGALGIRYPVIQGAMQWLSGAELAAAASNAGGLGVIAAGSSADAEELRREIRRTRELTDKPFAVNFTLMPTRRPIVWEEYIAATLEEGVNIIETSGRNPEPYIPLIRSAKVKHLHKVARLRDALTAQRLGADAVTIVGTEAGGHPGLEDVPTLALVQSAVAGLKIPVIAGGGFADGRGLDAALALGAQGIVMGTRFMLSDECPLHPDIKEFMLKKSGADTMLVERSIKNLARVIRTPFAEKVLAMEEAGATLDELFPLLDGQRIKRAYASGATSDSLIYCGQSVGLIDEILSVKEIIEGTVRGAENR
jgi:nitronate monooxygenase